MTKVLVFFDNSYFCLSGWWVGLDLSLIPPVSRLKFGALRPFDLQGHLQRAHHICKTAIPERLKLSLPCLQTNAQPTCWSHLFFYKVCFSQCFYGWNCCLQLCWRYIPFQIQLCIGHKHKKPLLENIVNSILYQVMLVDEQPFQV